MIDSQLHDLLELGADVGTESAPPANLLARARGRRRKIVAGRAASVAAGVAAFGLGGATVATGGLPFMEGRPAVAPAVAYADAPTCVKDVLARANYRVQQDQMAVVVADLRASQSLITQGIGSGYGWVGAAIVTVLAPQAGITPPKDFSLWGAVTPQFDAQAGRNLLLVTLDRSPKLPSEEVGGPIWIHDSESHFPITGDRMTVTCADGTTAAIPWAAASSTWLGPDKPQQHLPPDWPTIDPKGENTHTPASTVSPAATADDMPTTVP